MKRPKSTKPSDVFDALTAETAKIQSLLGLVHELGVRTGNDGMDEMTLSEGVGAIANVIMENLEAIDEYAGQLLTAAKQELSAAGGAR